MKMYSGVRVLALLTLLVAGSLQYVIKNNVIPKNRPVVRIVGGADAVKNAYPYQLYNVISIGLGKALCGGAILSVSWCLTAAHCTDSTTQDGIESTAGEHDLTQYDGTEQTRTSTTIIVHEGYNGRTFENDISVFKVDPPWNLTKVVAKICIPPGTAVGSPNPLKITGWGSTSEGGSTSTILQVANVSYVPIDSCRAAYVGSTIFDSNICAGGGTTDTCQGDSGGPLVNLRIYGIASWGNGCARPGYPGVYTRVNYFSTWINNTTNITTC